MNKQEVSETVGSTSSTAGRCEVCNRHATYMCSSCGASGPRYCSQECQTAGWTQGHYSVCVANTTSPRSAGGYNVGGAETGSAEDGAPVRRSLSTTRRRKSQRTSMGRWNAAQLINARRRASTTDPTSPTSPNTATNPLPGIPLSNLGSSALPSALGLDSEAAEELKFYMHQIYLVIQPVVLCIVLSIFWVKIAFSGKSNYQ
ncbi:hypothetical protein BC937DRAFT_87895 [Endogone sp. FLAS-F59071]|nr:hypothetical protein BC937DRAFT_87895 [Endogone sp. FLAS-F59071]|eukprot:RUS19180.1 hypothetical protein BC937DRAFT_87895 [Endogone sp. FLAS-F59071]